MAFTCSLAKYPVCCHAICHIAATYHSKHAVTYRRYTSRLHRPLTLSQVASNHAHNCISNASIVAVLALSDDSSDSDPYSARISHLPHFSSCQAVANPARSGRVAGGDYRIAKWYCASERLNRCGSIKAPSSGTTLVRVCTGYVHEQTPSICYRVWTLYKACTWLVHSLYMPYVQVTGHFAVYVQAVRGGITPAVRVCTRGGFGSPVRPVTIDGLELVRISFEHL